MPFSKSLKKWKGELPIDNTFTVTSWADLKSETTDTTKQSKKKNKNVNNAKVVYMWAMSPNPNWPKDKIPTVEESESGDPRFNRLEFNVLLKQSKNGEWKATLERDSETKVEAQEIIENDQDSKVIQDLFQTDKNDNKFTEKEEVLVEISYISSSSLSSVVFSSQNSVSSSTSNSSSTTAITNSSTQNINSVSSKISLLDILFGTPKVSAGENDYSWPWKSGDSYSISQGWHGSGVVGSIDGYDYQESKDYKNIALDISGTIAGKDVLSPVKGTTSRVCDDGSQATVLIGRMRLLHISSSGFTSGINYNKSQEIGTVYPFAINSGCGYSTGAHLHIKMLDDNMNIDGTVLNYSTNYSGFNFTSQNTPTPPKPPVYNNNSGGFNFYGWQFDVKNYGEVNGAGNYDGSPIQISYNTGALNNAQKWGYNQYSKEIKGMNDYCLDAGNSQKLQLWTCNGTNNQKWSIHPNNWIQNDQTGQCINIPNGYANSILAFAGCGATGWMQWTRVGISIPGRVAFRRENTNRCLASYYPYNLKQITTQDCNNNDQSQQWEWIWNGNGYAARQFGTNYCLDTYNPSQNSNIYSYECNWSDAQKWWYDSSKLLSRTAGNSNGQCAAKWNPQNGSVINAYPCSSNNYNDPNLRWDAYGV